MPHLVLHLAIVAALASVTCASLRAPETNAFASLLCDDDTLPAIQALASSIRRAGHSEPLLVLVPTTLSKRTLHEVSALPNTQPLHANSLPYPFNSTADRMEIHKPCRYLKLQLWGATHWRKIIFLDADTIVRHNIAELFEAPGFSAVKDPVGMNFNTGVIVIAPSAAVHSVLVTSYAAAGSYNVGDQGALNALIDYSAWHALPMRYNTFLTADDEVFDRAKILHFSGDAKPWNFWRAGGRGVVAQRGFDEWCTASKGFALSECHARGELPNGGSDTTRTKLGVVSHESQFSVVLSTYNRKEWHELADRYAALPEVAEVVIVWQNVNRPHEEAPNAKTRFVYVKDDSLNNRYVAPNLQTSAAYICDDDIYVPDHSLRTAFDLWRQNIGRLVGFYPRLHTRAPEVYSVDVSHGYNIVLTKGMFAHKDYLMAYSRFVPKRLTDFVDSVMNCEDILFGMMAVGMAGLPPLAIMSNETIHDAGKDKGISGLQSSGHLGVRDKCVTRFVREGMAGLTSTAPMLMSRGSVLPFGKKNHVVGAEASAS